MIVKVASLRTTTKRLQGCKYISSRLYRKFHAEQKNSFPPADRYRNLTIINVLTIFIRNNLSGTRRSHETPVCDTRNGQLGAVGRAPFGCQPVARASRGLYPREKSRGCCGPRLP